LALAKHLPAALHFAGLGQLAQGLKPPLAFFIIIMGGFFVAIIGS
jgi:hypothetical protein